MLMFEDLENYEVEKQLAGDFDSRKGKNKSLTMITIITKELPHPINFVVKSHKKVIFKSIDIRESIKAYNQI